MDMLYTISGLLLLTTGVSFAVGWFTAERRYTSPYRATEAPAEIDFQAQIENLHRAAGDDRPLNLSAEQHVLIADALASLDDARELAAPGSLERDRLEGVHDTVAALAEGVEAVDVPLWPAQEVVTFGSKPVQDWDVFWKDIVTDENGDVNIEQVQRELHDYHVLMRNVATVYEYITGGAITKQFTKPEHVIREADSYYERMWTMDEEGGDEDGSS